MHVGADLLDGVGDVRAGECRVLEGTSEAPELSQISNRRPIIGEDLGLRVHHCGNRLVVHHVSALKDIESVLVL
jgi:hypothetical protein